MRKDKSLTSIARTLRRSQTDAENKLWAQLRGRNTAGAKFRRQQPIGPFIVDFVSFEHRLIIEVDGGHHDKARARALDKARTAWLEGNGFRVMRFWNNEVQRNLDGVLVRISDALRAGEHPHLNPLPSRERR